VREEELLFGLRCRCSGWFVANIEEAVSEGDTSFIRLEVREGLAGNDELTGFVLHVVSDALFSA